MRTRLLVFFFLFLAASGIVAATCPNETGVWIVNTTTTQSTDVLNCTMINVTNGVTLTLGNNISVNTTVFLIENGTVTHDVFGLVNITAVNLTIQIGAINATGKGYVADTGPGNGTTHSGASHAGWGGSGYENTVLYPSNATVHYGSSEAADTYGSGGYTGSTSGGAGGGRIILAVTGTLNVSGDIRSDGSPGSASVNFPGGGGSGGSIRLAAGTLTGSGTIAVRGGRGGDDTADDDDGGGGGGGYLRATVTTNAFTGTLDARGELGTGYSVAEGGGPGVLYIEDLSAGTITIILNNTGIDLDTPVNVSNLSVPVTHLLLMNVTVVGGPITVNGTTSFIPGVVSFSAPIAGTSNITVPNGSVVKHLSGGNELISINGTDIIIMEGGIINTTDCGYATGAGPGGGSARAGGSHASQGGGSSTNGATNARTSVFYGNVTEPTSHGSGGGAGDGTDAGGGGVILLNATGTITINGTITAQGERGGDTSVGPGGGGSGGSILLRAGTFTGIGTISVDGGGGGVDVDDDDGGGGSGGRIALYYRDWEFTGGLTAIGGIGGTDPQSEDGGPGTIYRNETDAGFDMLTIGGGTRDTIGNDILITNLTANTTKARFVVLNLSNVTIDGTNITAVNITVYGKNVTTYLNLTAEANTTVESGAMLVTYGAFRGGNLTLENGSTGVLNGTTQMEQIMVFGSTNLTNNGFLTVTTMHVLANGQFISNGPVAATRMTVWNGGTVTHALSTTSDEFRVNITAVNLTIQTGASINATGKGYAGGSVSGHGGGPGGGKYVANRGGAGASHAGYGGNGGSSTGNTTIYGNLTAPVSTGSGGSGSNSHTGGAGGGSIVLTITGVLNKTGDIQANGGDGKIGTFDGTGGGSGGSIWITANTITGTGNTEARGGNGDTGSSEDEGGGGGGGRIAIYHATPYTGTLLARGGNHTGNAATGGAGTIYTKDLSTGKDTLSISNGPSSNTAITNLTGGTTEGTFNHLDITNATIHGITLTIADTFTVNAGTVYLNNFIAGTSNITITDGATLSHSDNAAGTYYILNITGANLNVSAGARIGLHSYGYPGGATNTIGNGPGNTSGSSTLGTGGASHGGTGGNGVGTSGATEIYGDLIRPTALGSGAGGADAAGGDGGGAVVINLTDTLTASGWIRADGANGSDTTVDCPGGGAGGSIWIAASTITGIGNITAKGGFGDFGTDDGGGGGGGRISLNYRTYAFNGLLSVAGGAAIGAGTAGNDGTIFRCQRSDTMSCPGSIGGISLSTIYLRNQTVNITRELTTDWTDTRLLWNETATDAATIGQYVLSGLTYANYKVWHNTTFNDSVLNNGGTLETFETNISGRVQISVLAPNNTAPYGANVRLNGSNNGAQVFPNEDLQCYLAASDADDLNVTAYWTIYNGTALYNESSMSILSTAEFHLLTTVPSTVTNPGETWTCGVIAGDSYLNLTQVNHSRTLELTAAPVLQTASITPQAAYTTDTLLGWCNATDSDNDTLIYYYAWYRNGTLNSSGVSTNGGANYTQGELVNVASVVPSLTTKHENWTFQCMASQMIANSTILNSTALTILNSVPTASNIILNSSYGGNTTYQDLTAYGGASDDDGDVLAYAYDWRLNGTSIALVNMNFDVNDSLGTGTVRDHSTNANHGVLAAGGARPKWNATGGINGTAAYWFNGSSYINISASPTFDIQNLTISAWVYSDNYARNMFIFEKGNVNTQYSLFFEAASSVITFRTYNTGATQNDLDVVHGLANNAWHHVAATYNGTHKAIYLDGVRTSPAAYTQTLRTGLGTEERIGAYGGTTPSYFFIGGIDNLAVYNRSLSPQEIFALSRNQTMRMPHQGIETSENWSVCATPNDADSNATTACSGNLTVLPNTPPTLGVITLNSTRGLNGTDENLTAHATITDIDNDPVAAAYDWRMNDSSIAAVNMNFDVENSNGTGSTRDHSSYGNNGSIHSATWNASLGYRDTAVYEFDSTADTINISSAPSVNLTGNLTFVVWAKFNTIQSGFFENVFLSKGAAGETQATNYQFIFYVNSTGGMRLWWESGGGVNTVVNSTAQASFSAGEWHQFAVTRDNGTRQVRFFFDGVQLGTNVTYINNSNGGEATRLVIGREASTSADDFQGRIDSVTVYNRPLNGTQILALYQNRTDVIVPEETELGQNWTVCITPNDQWSQGAMSCSDGLLIIASADSCTPPAIDTNWIVYAADNCTKSDTAIDLGTGNLTVSGEQGPGHLRFVTANITANNINVIGYGNLSRIVLENGARATIG